MRVGIFTARAVAADTELTFDYKWPRSSDRAPTTCMCGAPSCRGTLEVKPRRRNDGEMDVDFATPGNKIRKGQWRPKEEGS